MRIAIAKVAFLVVLLPGTASATTYSTPIAGFADDSSGEFVAGKFDFGLHFTTIEKVTVEITFPVGDLVGGYCTGSVCSFWSLVAIVYNPAHPPNLYRGIIDDLYPGYIEPNPSLMGSFQGLLRDKTSMANISPLNPDGVYASPLVPPQWPGFLLEGHGAVGMQKVTHWGCYLNCTESGFTGVAPIGVVGPRIIVEGEVVPEPSSYLLLLIAVAAVHCLRVGRKRYQLSGRPACDEGTCALHR